MSKKIAFFDSGIGGIPYLLYLRNIKSNYNYYYLADTAHFPYGTKSSDEIRDIVLSAVEKLIEKTDPDIVVIACNTASVVALKDLRQKYSIPFVGVVPAVKPAALISGNKRIGLFATNKTVSDNYTDNLIHEYANNCDVYKYADPGIVSFIEKELINTSEEKLLKLLKPAADYFINKNVDHVVLGCTHFMFIDKAFEKLFPNHIKTIDSREGVSKQIINLVENTDNAKPENKNSESQSLFYVTLNNNEYYYKKIAEKYKLDFSGVIAAAI